MCQVFVSLERCDAQGPHSLPAAGPLLALGCSRVPARATGAGARSIQPAPLLQPELTGPRLHVTVVGDTVPLLPSIVRLHCSVVLLPSHALTLNSSRFFLQGCLQQLVIVMAIFVCSPVQRLQQACHLVVPPESGHVQRKQAIVVLQSRATRSTTHATGNSTCIIKTATWMWMPAPA